jgi:cell division protease FtsH
LNAIRKIHWFNVWLILGFIYVPVSVIYAFNGGAYYEYGLSAAITPLLYIAFRLKQVRGYIDIQISEYFESSGSWTVIHKNYPIYRHYDLYKQTEAIASSCRITKTISSAHVESLTDILSSSFNQEENRKINTSEMIGRKVDVDEEKFIHRDIFRLVNFEDELGSAIIRVRQQYDNSDISLEISAPTVEACEKIHNKLKQLMTDKSIYRRKVVEADFQAEIRDTYGDIDVPESTNILFKRMEKVAEDDIILDENVKNLITNSIENLILNREKYKKFGLSIKRGILFHGPPGTGKTYTTKYLANRLPDVTTIIGAGLALGNIKAICNIARNLQPAIVVLEDIDLLFSHRELNVNTLKLGELMDQLDGFGDNEDVIFLLTTNSIDRVEEAIKNRPGRISQCIYMGAPNANLRKKYIENILKSLEFECSCVSQISELTKSATQAFIKELINRAIQYGADEAESDKKFRLEFTHFQRAYDDMLSGTEKSIKRIIGFTS